MSIKFGRILKIVNDNLPLSLKKKYIKRKSREELFKYWNAPDDGRNMPMEYLRCRERSIFLLSLITKHIDKESRILEIGCNVGRNLNELFCAGFDNLSGIEISKNAIATMGEAYPEMAKQIAVHNGPVENLIQNFEDDSFDLVFTMAVLEHIHTDSEFVFPHMARITKRVLVTIEDEKGLSWRHFPRNYKKVFENLGMRQIEEVRLRAIKVPGLNGNFVARVFKK